MPLQGLCGGQMLKCFHERQSANTISNRDIPVTGIDQYPLLGAQVI